MKPQFLIPNICFRHVADSLSSTKKSEIIRLVHFTGQEYFQDTLNRWFPRAHFDIANTCVSYLSFKDSSGGPVRAYEKARERL